jgi:hypothetical protein
MVGAAAKMPPRLLGLKMSPRIEKRMTTVPPMRKRARRSGTSGLLSGLCDEGEGGLFALDGEEFVLLAFELVVVDEEVLDLFDGFFGEVFDGFYVGPHVRCVGYGDEAIVAVGLLAVGLLAFDDADEAGHKSAAGEGGFIHKNEDVDGIAVVGEGAGEEAEVVGEDHAGGKRGFEDEDFLEVVEAVLVVGTFGGFDDDLEELVAGFGDAAGGFVTLFGERLEAGGVDEAGLGGFGFLAHDEPNVNRV